MPFQANSTLTCTQLGWVFLPEFGTCGGSDAGMGGCLPRATWLEAFQRCEQYGARLCTRFEVEAAKGTGCNLDDQMIWTWEECQHGTPGEQHVAAMGNNHRIYTCAEPTTLYGVRCCADEASGIPPSSAASCSHASSCNCKTCTANPTFTNTKTGVAEKVFE